MAKSRRSNDQPVRVLLAADLRLGAAVADLPELAEPLRPVALDAAARTFETLVGTAVEQSPDAVLLTGVTLAADADLAAVRTLRAGAETLAEAGIPLVVAEAPGGDGRWADVPRERLDPAGDAAFTLKRGKRVVLRIAPAAACAEPAGGSTRTVAFGSADDAVPEHADLFIPTDPGPRHRLRDGGAVVHHPGPACPVAAGEVGTCAATLAEFRKDGVRLSERPVSPLRRERFQPPLLDEPAGEGGGLPEHLRTLADAVETAPHERLRLTSWTLQPGPWGDRWRKKSGREKLLAALDAGGETDADGTGTAVVHRVRVSAHPELLRAEEGSLAFAFAGALEDVAGGDEEAALENPRLAELLASVPEADVAAGAVRWGLPLLAAE